jgi:hypothetical protein
MTTSSIPGRPDYRHVAEALAASHRRADPHVIKIWLAVDPTQQEVRLVEVTTESPTTMDQLTVRFRPTAEVPLPSAVLLLSPAEWAAIEREEMELPVGWERLEEL